MLEDGVRGDPHAYRDGQALDIAHHGDSADTNIKEVAFHGDGSSFPVALALSRARER